MNQGKVNIMLLLKRLALTTALSAMLFQLSAQTVAFLTYSYYEFEMVGLDGQEESKEEEKQENENKDEKVEMQILSSSNPHFSFVTERTECSPLKRLSNFSMEIPIPPPQQH